jgi:hypothetical protein
MTNWNTTELAGSKLVLHCGANRVDWNDVRAVHTPHGTATHCPVPHDFLVDQVREGLDQMGFAISEEVHALYGDGLRYFGLLALKAKVGREVGGDTEVGQGRRFVFGVRNGHDKSVVAGGVLGTQVFVCDNLAMHSGDAMFRFQRKHTRWAMRDLPQIIATRIGNLRMAMQTVAEREKSYAEYDFEKHEQDVGVRRGTFVNDCLLRCLRAGAINVSALTPILHQFHRADGPGGHAHAGEAWQRPTMFRLLQAVTEVEKEKPGLLNLTRRHSRLTGILDAVVSGSEFVDADAEVAEV